MELSQIGHNCNCRAYMCYNLLFQSFKLWLLNSINIICAIVIISMWFLKTNKKMHYSFTLEDYGKNDLRFN